MNYKILSAFLGVCVIVLLWFVTTPQKENDQNQASVPKIEELSGRTPENFPAELVVPAGAADVKNYKVTASDNSRTDLTQTFTTSQSISATIAYYKKIFADNGWQVETITDEAKNKMLLASKGPRAINLAVFQDGTGKTQVRVTATILAQK